MVFSALFRVNLVYTESARRSSMFLLMVAAKSTPEIRTWDLPCGRRGTNQYYATPSFSAGLTVPNIADQISLLSSFPYIFYL